MIIGPVGMRFVRRDEKHFTCRDGKSASINFGPPISFGAKDQNAFIKPVKPADPVRMRLGIPSETFNMQTDTERMPGDLVEQIGR
jgi:hypothetical protein